jgi:hypothetical protein
MEFRSSTSRAVITAWCPSTSVAGTARSLGNLRPFADRTALWGPVAATYPRRAIRARLPIESRRLPVRRSWRERSDRRALRALVTRLYGTPVERVEQVNEGFDARSMTPKQKADCRIVEEHPGLAALIPRAGSEHPDPQEAGNGPCHPREAQVVLGTPRRDRAYTPSPKMPAAAPPPLQIEYRAWDSERDGRQPRGDFHPCAISPHRAPDSFARTLTGSRSASS